MDTDTRRVSDLEPELAEVTTKYNAFRDRVRRSAIVAHRDNHWGLDELNAVLAELGLPAYQPSYACHGTVDIPVRVRVDTDDPYAAEQIVRNHVARLRVAVETTVRQLDDLPVTVTESGYPSVGPFARNLVVPDQRSDQE